MFIYFTMVLSEIKYFINAYHTSKLPLIRTNFIDEPRVTKRIDFLITDPFDLKLKHLVNDGNLINLAGGIPTANFIDAHFRGYSVNEDVYKTEAFFDFGWDASISNNLFGKVTRTIDFKRRQIKNEEVQLQKKDTGFGTNCFLNQVNEARALGFRLFTMHAAGGTDYPTRSGWEGYKIWAKYGYIMVPYSQNKYDGWRKKFNLKARTLNKLYWSGEKYDLWRKAGFSWEGTFDLADGSLSIKYLKHYLAAKHINVKLSPFRFP